MILSSTQILSCYSENPVSPPSEKAPQMSNEAKLNDLYDDISLEDNTPPKALLEFLDEHQINDFIATTTNTNSLSNDDEGPSNSHPTGNLHCLADTPNYRSPKQQTPKQTAFANTNEETFQDSCNTNSMRRNTRKYIWDDWEETNDGHLVQLRDLAIADNEVSKVSNTQTTGDSQRETARRQLQDIKAIGEEIQSRAFNMKEELVEKSLLVEELHSTRVQNEADHVKQMKCLKKQWKEKFEEAKSKHEKVSLPANAFEPRHIIYQLTIAVVSYSSCIIDMSKVTSQQKAVLEELKNARGLLLKKEMSLKLVIERINESEKDMCERLQIEGLKDIENAQRSWQQAELQDLKRREQQLSPKLKRDAAKAVEPKLRKMMDIHEEEVGRLQRESTRELDSFKLELFRKCNSEFKKEANRLRDNERRRTEKLESEWAVKSEDMRREHEFELRKVRSEHQRITQMTMQQFNVDKQACIDQHHSDLEAAKKTNEMEMEQLTLTHEREMKLLEDTYRDMMTEKQRRCEK